MKYIIKKHLSLLLRAALAVVLAVSATACHGDDEWDEMPAPIANFVSKYFAGQGINSYSYNGNVYHVRINDGPGLSFGTDYAWIAVDGYGMPLPQVFLFDQLPPKVYAYLQDSQQLDAVFAVERDTSRYTLTLLSTTLIYDIDTGELSGTVPTAAAAFRV